MAFGGEELVCEAELDGRGGVHPGFGVHHPRQFRPRQAGFVLVGVNDRILDRLEHRQGFREFVFVADGEGGRVVDHQHRYRTHRHRLGGHRDHRRSRRGDPVNVDRHLAGVSGEQVIDLRCRNHVTARAVEPDRHRPRATIQLGRE